MTPRRLDGHRDRPARMVFVDRDHFGCTCGAPAAGPRCAGRECDNSQPRPTGLRPVRLPRAAQLLPRTARCAGAVVLRRQQLDASHLVTGGGSPDLRSSLSTARTSARPPGPKWAAALGTAQPAATSKVNLDGASASIRPRVYGVLLMRPHVTTNRAGLAAMSSPTRRACDQPWAFSRRIPCADGIAAATTPTANTIQATRCTEGAGVPKPPNQYTASHASPAIRLTARPRPTNIQPPPRRSSAFADRGDGRGGLPGVPMAAMMVLWTLKPYGSWWRSL